jgi:hypothetical protein
LAFAYTVCGTIGPVSALVSLNSQSSIGFALKLPLTMRIVAGGGFAGKSVIVIKSLLLVGRANIAGIINL